MDFTQLKYFKTIAELEHMTKAAEVLHVAQPALSRVLKNLESELGVKLFDRVGHRIVLNENGRILLNRTESILREHENIIFELDERKENQQQPVTVMMYAATKLLPELILGFKEKYPEIRLDIMHQNSQLSVGFSPDITVFSSMLQPEGINETTLLVEELYLALPMTNPLSERDEIDLADVSDQPFICLHKGMGLREITDEYCGMAGFRPKTILESDNPGIIRDLISLGIGLAFIPPITWRGMEKTESIKLLKISNPHCTRHINMRSYPDKYQTAAVKKFKEYLIDFFYHLMDDTG